MELSPAWEVRSGTLPGPETVTVGLTVNPPPVDGVNGTGQESNPEGWTAEKLAMMLLDPAPTQVIHPPEVVVATLVF